VRSSKLQVARLLVSVFGLLATVGLFAVAGALAVTICAPAIGWALCGCSTVTASGRSRARE